MTVAAGGKRTGEDLPASLARNLRGARAKADLTQEVLAVRAGLSSSTVDRIERGSYRPRLATIEALADVLGVTTVSLLSASTEDPEPEQSEAVAG